MIRALALTGPTASGKTSLSLSLAKELGCEIICCDSMQIYREMDIGTAKATLAERAEAEHHMLDFLSPGENYSAENYREDAMRVAESIAQRGKIPLFCGGTGLYLDTLMRGGELMSPPSNEELKESLISNIKTDEDKTALWQRLNEVDPESAAKIHRNNVRRVARAVEIYELTGKTKTYFDALSKATNDRISVGVITLDFHDRDNLYRRVDERVDMMMAEGLLAEARSLYERGLLDETYTSSQAIGYKELLSYIKGEGTLEDATELIKLSSRRYAKRQLTWFRHVDGAYKLYIDTDDGVMRDKNDLLTELYSASRNLLLSL